DGAHVRVDVTENPHDAGPGEALPPGRPRLVQPHIESFAVVIGERIVEDWIEVGKIYAGAHPDRQYVRSEGFILLDHLRDRVGGPGRERSRDRFQPHYYAGEIHVLAYGRVLRIAQFHAAGY